MKVLNCNKPKQMSVSQPSKWWENAVLFTPKGERFNNRDRYVWRETQRAAKSGGEHSKLQDVWWSEGQQKEEK